MPLPGGRSRRALVRQAPRGRRVASSTRGGQESAYALMGPVRPQRNGHADADGDDEDESECETNEKAAHCLSLFPRKPICS